MNIGISIIVHYLIVIFDNKIHIIKVKFFHHIVNFPDEIAFKAAVYELKLFSSALKAYREQSIFLCFHSRTACRTHFYFKLFKLPLLAPQ